MVTFLLILFWCAFAVGLMWAVGYLHHRLYVTDRRPDAIYYLSTEDEWRLSLHRYEARSPIGGAPPVVLCPGTGFSGAIFCLENESSLAQFLSSEGYDVWVADLRGSCAPARRRLNWSFDDFVDFDVPAIVDRVCQVCGNDRVQWVGFGSGALAMLAQLGSTADPRIASVAGLGTTVFFRRQRLLFGGAWLRRLARIRPDFLVKLVAPLLGRIYPGGLKYLLNRDNVDGAMVRRAFAGGVARIGRNEAAQLTDWLSQDSCDAVVQQRDYRAALETVTAPTLFVAGPRDEIAPVDMVEATAALMTQSKPSKVVLASRMHGMSTNYGHLDLVLGRSARRDIYTHLLSWLDQHAGVDLPANRPAPPRPREGWSGVSEKAAAEELESRQPELF